MGDPAQDESPLVEDRGDELEAWREVPEVSPATSRNLVWLAPIRGLVPPLVFAIEQPPAPQVELEPGLVWRGATEVDRQAMERYWDFFSDGYAKVLTEGMTWQQTLLAWTSPEPAESAVHPFPRLLCFLTAASIHTRVSVRTMWLRFEVDSGADSLLPHSGGVNVSHTCHLPTWPDQAQFVTDSEREEIADTYRQVWEFSLVEPDSHPLRHALGAYRTSVMSAFLETTAIQLCAVLECLAGTQNKDRVVGGLLGRYPQDDHASALRVARDLFKLRNGYLHPRPAGGRLTNPQVRKQVLDSGMQLTKSLLASALRDGELALAAKSGADGVSHLMDH